MTKIDKTELTPAITMDGGGKLHISGKSMMEDAAQFYTPVYNWLSDQCDLQSEVGLVFELDYFNSSSAKQLLRLLILVDDAGINAEVKWYYPEHNDVLKERGQELQFMVDLPFNFLTK
jgi:hypothetical protein